MHETDIGYVGYAGESFGYMMLVLLVIRGNLWIAQRLMSKGVTAFAVVVKAGRTVESVSVGLFVPAV